MRAPNGRNHKCPDDLLCSLDRGYRTRTTSAFNHSAPLLPRNFKVLLLFSTLFESIQSCFLPSSIPYLPPSKLGRVVACEIGNHSFPEPKREKERLISDFNAKRPTSFRLPPPFIVIAPFRFDPPYRSAFALHAVHPPQPMPNPASMKTGQTIALLPLASTWRTL